MWTMTMRPVRALWVAACVLLAAWVGVAHAQSTQVVVDAMGRKVTVPVPVKRVALNFNFEEFTAVAGVDSWQRVVGISRTPWESWRPAIFKRYAQVIPNLQAMPDIGHSEDGTFSAEKVIALKPDVLFIAEWTYSAMETARQQIEAAGIPIVVVDYNAQLLERHLASTRVIGKVMGTSARAEELAKLYESEYSKVLARVPKNAARKKVYVELAQAGADTVGNSYSGTMWGKMITLLGADNVADGKLPGPWGPVSQEAVLAADPDVIVFAGSSWVNKPKAVRTGFDATPEEIRANLKPYTERPGYSSLKAVRNGEVNVMEHGLCRTLFDFVALQYLAKRLYPEQFKDVDPAASLKAYYDKYLPVKYSGVWMLPIKP
ncbi:ABC transporter substrate-binding protein [Curvibacter sp. CHRR-16]|uniref:ABC transporter substrate-binding protein n=1 Tax=Curvibacter sp. CHRR-16 TaxID=2835872 RepID=UPI001BDA5A9E|nr:ABC transporter substrate-binding protein [Curvibacter sp. CHRR-16]MBT0569826.1 ABC transporter substrate-binding protein [Curvibacter sp. CHRR-16]